MERMKGMLLGSAATLVVAVAGAHAADLPVPAGNLPVKARPVKFVKVCSLYGAGFWYVPGTDTCLKIGSYIREEVEWNAGNGGVPIGFGTNDAAAAGRFDRTDTSQLSMRTRAALTVDLRTQTEYGTLRSYFEGGFQSSANNGSAPTNDWVYFDRAFIQFAGVTAGRIRSYFDIVSPYQYGYFNSRVSGDTSEHGLWGIAYTMQFANGFSATVSVEDGGSTSQGNNFGQNSARGHQTVNLSMPSQFGLGTIEYDNAGFKIPDVIGALRSDQSWGYAQLSVALHDASGGYYQTGGASLMPGIQANGHPPNAYGWAVTGGFHLNDILGLKGDTFAVQATYSVGAVGYVSSASAGQQIYGGGNQAAFGWFTDGVFSTGSRVELTTVWGLYGGYQHFWNPKWRTSLYGGYVEADYDGAATAMICPAGTGTAAPVGAALIGVANCSPNSSFYNLGSRTQWIPHPDLDIGVDVMWTHLNTAFAGTATLAANGARPAGIYQIADQDVISAVFRIQRNFLP